MEITVERKTSWIDVVNAARMTVGKAPNDKEPKGEWKRGILLAEHSPIRELLFTITIKGLPYYCHTHFVRHNIGVNWYVKTSREDRTGVPRSERKQTDPVDMKCVLNAQALINISRRRLCSKADPETRRVWREVVEAVRKVDPVVASCCVPNCVYRGRCPEMQGCGWDKSEAFKGTVEAYWV